MNFVDNFLEGSGGMPLGDFLLVDSDHHDPHVESSGKVAPEEEYDYLLPPTQKCGLPAVDLYDQYAEHTGYYHLRLTNDAAWLFSTTYKVIVLDQTGKEIQATNQKAKWIKQGAKPK
ncbi:hypothetical protein TELCIR_00776 [Teladorsagia circumcincta]|uniref:Ctg-1-like C-terminal domain-containing protein n=1 Tax=Teladorsagia circumcincta TaxID=45464 RepID=A0A2G9V401_TELCI|nr:hypothetical protein TELCIR_00776 [Teladorsagia circumcincta]